MSAAFRFIATSLISAQLRTTVVERAENRCEYCHLSQEFQVATFPVDHISPISLSGLTELGNLALACPRCNAMKWKYVEAEDSETGNMVGLFNPRIHRWPDHFRWAASDNAILEPLTPIGRVTIRLLEMNSDQHLAIRSLLKLLGLHPPGSEFGAQ